MSAPCTRSRLQALIDRIRSLRIGVVGDFTLDGYWHADMERSELSRETPLYPRPITKETYSLGGAANVAWNLADLGAGEVWAFSVIGDDWRGHLLRGLLQKEGIRDSELLNQADRVTPFYGKMVLHAAGRVVQEDARLDFINTMPLSEAVETVFLERLASCLPTLDALIVADYQRQGIMTPHITAGLLELAKKYAQIPIVVDSRERASEFRSLVLKPNDMEAARLFFPDREPGSVSINELTSAALQHTTRSGQPIFITRGEQGCLVCSDNQCQLLAGVQVAPPVDTVGAGDAFMAALSAGLAAHAAPIEAACLANLAAAVTVKKIGVTGTASPDEVLSLFDQWITSSAG